MLIIDKQIAKAEEQVCKSNQILGHVEFFMAPAHLAPFLSQQTCLSLLVRSCSTWKGAEKLEKLTRLEEHSRCSHCLPWDWIACQFWHQLQKKYAWWVQVFCKDFSEMKCLFNSRWTLLGVPRPENSNDHTKSSMLFHLKDHKQRKEEILILDFPICRSHRATYSECSRMYCTCLGVLSLGKEADGKVLTGEKRPLSGLAFTYVEFGDSWK